MKERERIMLWFSQLKAVLIELESSSAFASELLSQACEISPAGFFWGWSVTAHSSPLCALKTRGQAQSAGLSAESMGRVL